MPKFVSDTLLDAALDALSNNADTYVICEGRPGTYADATTDATSGGNALGETSIGPAAFTKSDGDVSGRKVTVAAQTDIDIDVDGTADHAALVDTATNRLLLVTDGLSQAVTQGSTLDTDAFSQEIADPS